MTDVWWNLIEFAMEKQIPSYYVFGPFRLNVTERLLEKAHEVVPLSPKLLDLLFVLVENVGRLLKKRT